MGIPAEVIDMKDYDPDDQLADEVSQVQREDAFSVRCKGQNNVQTHQYVTLHFDVCNLSD